MSVKTMTTESLQNDLKSIAQMWPGGIPTEQNDRVNALKSELKCRNATLDASEMMPREKVTEGAADVLSDERLASEMHKLSDRLSKNPKDEDAQTRFADIRFEIRRRAKVAPQKTGAFDPVTGVTDMSAAAAPLVPDNVLDEMLTVIREQRNHALLIVDQMMKAHDVVVSLVNGTLRTHKEHLNQLAAKLMETP
jgi:CBS-domain-containing membrane protein